MSDDPTDERTDENAADAATGANGNGGATGAATPDPEPNTTTDTDTTTMTDTDSDTEAETDDATDGSAVTGERVRRALNYLLLAGLAIFALVAAVGFYTASTSAISTWVTPEYRPLVRAAFNLVVLLVVGAAIVRQARRLS